MRSVVVGAIGQHYRQAVGLVVGAHKMVRRRFTGAVGTVGAVRSGFGEVAFRAQGSKDLVRADVVKTLAVKPSAFQAATAALSKVTVPSTLVRTKAMGSAMERSTWLSAAKWITPLGWYSAKSRVTSAASVMSTRSKT